MGAPLGRLPLGGWAGFARRSLSARCNLSKSTGAGLRRRKRRLCRISLRTMELTGSECLVERCLRGPAIQAGPEHRSCARQSQQFGTAAVVRVNSQIPKTD